MGQKVDFLKFVCQKKGLRYVGARGNPKAPVWFIGEAPGADEDQEGVPFVGYSGKQLDGQIAEAGLSLSDCFFTNPYRVRPPDNEIERRGELGIPDSVFLDAFWEDLYENRPTFIIAAGATPLAILCPNTVSRRDGSPRISAWRGSLLSCDRFDWPHYVVPMYHPAFILREYSQRPISVFCIERAKEELDFWRSHGSIQPLPRRGLIDDPSFDDVIAFLHDCLRFARKGCPISHDIENPFWKRIQLPYVMNFAYEANSAISFNLWDWPVEKLAILWPLMAKVLEEAILIGQNYLNYDAPYQEESCGLRPNIGELHDTMTRHKVLWPEFEHALQFQTIQYTREPYYKDESHDFDITSQGKRKLRTYGAKDAAVTYEIWAAQENELDARGLRDFYEKVEMPLARNLHCIQNRGIQVNTAKLAELRTKLNKRLEGICTDAMKYIGKPVFYDGDSAKEFQKFAKEKANGKIRKQSDVEVFNLGSPKQIIKVFEDLDIYLPSQDGKIKTDEEAMQKSFAKTGHQLPGLILLSRGLNKLKGTNIDASLRQDVLYTNFYSTGTVNGRRSSTMLWDDTPFCYGSNTQNLPKHGKGDIGIFQKEYRECLVARRGKIFLAADQIQAEDWIVTGIIADQSGQMQGFNELRQGTDRHRKLATQIFRKAWDECGKESHERYLAKKSRHAGNYDMGGYRFAAVLTKEGMTDSPIPGMGLEEYCDSLLVAFHFIEPGIRGVFHRYIQQKLEDTRTLINCFGRTRIFFGLHPHRDNTKVFKEAYSTLPQSTVSDNTAQAVNIIEAEAPGLIIKEDHDALTLEVDDEPTCISAGIDLLSHAFDRVITMEKGLKFKIPIEFELGYNLRPASKGKFNGLIGVDKSNFEEVREKLRQERLESQTCHA